MADFNEIEVDFLKCLFQKYFLMTFKQYVNFKNISPFQKWVNKSNEMTPTGRILKHVLNSLVKDFFLHGTDNCPNIMAFVFPQKYSLFLLWRCKSHHKCKTIGAILFQVSSPTQCLKRPWNLIKTSSSVKRAFDTSWSQIYATDVNDCPKQYTS